MSRDSAYLLDIFKATKLALSYLEGKNKEDFFKDTQCQDAVIRRLEIIGEAAGRVSVATTTKFQNLPWKKMVSMRNIMIHEYERCRFRYCLGNSPKRFAAFDQSACPPHS